MTLPADQAAALAAHRRRVDGLCRALAAPATGAVQRIETHLSTVLLAGEAAYKLKKPLAPGFVDFRSLASREHFVREELRLNRRLAPALYREVRPVLGSDDAPRLGAADEAGAIDWVLVMQRFDPSQALDALARADRLAPLLIDALAATLADFHAALPPADPRFGDPDTAWHWVEDTLGSLRSDAAATEQPRVEQLARWSRQRFDALRATMQARREAGWVREGHGDLHLANIALIDGHPTPFDALEFSAELRCIDVIDDLAFPFMDLQAHGLPALAWRLVNGWCERTGDHAGLALLAWYAVQRALVRAKVALLAAADPGQAAARADRLGDAARYGATAERLAEPVPPRLVVVWGLSGSGKSTVALHVAEALGAIRLRSDVERKRLHGLSPTDRPADAAVLYSADAGRRTYARLGELAAALLAAGLPVVVDAACLKQAERLALRHIAADHGAAFHLLECRSPIDVLRARVAARQAAGADASDATLGVLDAQRGWLEPLAPTEAGGAEWIDTAVTPAALADACRQRAAQWLRGTPTPSR